MQSKVNVRKVNFCGTNFEKNVEESGIRCSTTKNTSRENLSTSAQDKTRIEPSVYLFN